jgi:CRP-like cAMP-binding protein
MANNTDSKEVAKELPKDTVNPRKEYKAGEFIFKEGDPSNCMYIIKSGQVEVYKMSSDSKRIPLTIINSGEFLGEMSLLTGKMHSAAAMALTDVVTVQISKAGLDAELSNCAFWLVALMKGLVNRLHTTNDIMRRNNFVDSSMMTAMEAAEQKVKKPA